MRDGKSECRKWGLGSENTIVCTKINMGPGFSPQVLSSEVGPAEEHQGGSRRGIIIYEVDP